MAKRADKDFTKLYNAVIDRVWGELTPTAQAIYPVLQRFANYTHRCAGISQTFIGKKARRARPIKQSNVARAITELVGWGLVVREITTRGLVYYLPRQREILEYLARHPELGLNLEPERKPGPKPCSEAEAEPEDTLPAEGSIYDLPEYQDQR